MHIHKKIKVNEEVAKALKDDLGETLYKTLEDFKVSELEIINDIENDEGYSILVAKGRDNNIVITANREYDEEGNYYDDNIVSVVKLGLRVPYAPHDFKNSKKYLERMCVNKDLADEINYDIDEKYELGLNRDTLLSITDDLLRKHGETFLIDESIVGYYDLNNPKDSTRLLEIKQEIENALKSSNIDWIVELAKGKEVKINNRKTGQQKNRCALKR